MRRSAQRRGAVFALYQHDLTGRPLADTLPGDASPFSHALAHATLDRRPELDELIDRHATGWSIERIAPLERSILRVGLLELLHPGELPGEEPIPPEGAIDEAVQAAKTYCGPQTSGFVNGILAAVLRERQKTGGAA